MNKTNEELVKEYQEGNSRALEQLIEQNKGLCNKIINKFYIHDNSIDREDLLQESRMGIMIAAEKYSNDKGMNFVTYAYYWIFARLHRLLCPRSKKNYDYKFISLEEQTGDGITLGETLADDQDDICNVEEMIWLEELGAELHAAINSNCNYIQSQIIYFHYGFQDGKCYFMKEISTKTGMPVSKVISLHDKALNRIRGSKYGRTWLQEHEEELGY